MFPIYATGWIWCLNWINVFWFSSRSLRFSRQISKLQRSIELFFILALISSSVPPDSLILPPRYMNSSASSTGSSLICKGSVCLFWMCRPTLCAVSCKEFMFSCKSWGWCATRGNSRCSHLPCSVQWMPFPELVLSSVAVCSRLNFRQHYQMLFQNRQNIHRVVIAILMSVLQ